MNSDSSQVWTGLQILTSKYETKSRLLHVAILGKDEILRLYVYS